MLQRGGNAVDAAVATAFAVGVVNPSSCGLGGGGFMLIYLARDHRAVALDYREAAPAAATPDMFVRDGRAVPALSQVGGLAVAVPGEAAGLSLVLRRFGTLPLATTLEPAIRYARDGFVIEPHLAREIARNQDAFRADPDLARTFLRADGSPLDTGDTLRRPELAHTLERLAHDGPEPFYRGDIAAAIAASTQRSGGILTDAGPGDLPSALAAPARRPVARRRHLHHAAAEFGRRGAARSPRHVATRRPTRTRAGVGDLPAPAGGGHEPRVRRSRPVLWRPRSGPGAPPLPAESAQHRRPAPAHLGGTHGRTRLLRKRDRDGGTRRGRPRDLAPVGHGRARQRRRLHDDDQHQLRIPRRRR